MFCFFGVEETTEEMKKKITFCSGNNQKWVANFPLICDSAPYYLVYLAHFLLACTVFTTSIEIDPAVTP